MEGINVKKGEVAPGHFLGKLAVRRDNINGIREVTLDERTSEKLTVVKMGPHIKGYDPGFGVGAKVLVTRLQGTKVTDGKHEYLVLPNTLVCWYE